MRPGVSQWMSEKVNKQLQMYMNSSEEKNCDTISFKHPAATTCWTTARQPSHQLSVKDTSFWVFQPTARDDEVNKKGRQTSKQKKHKTTTQSRLWLWMHNVNYVLLNFTRWWLWCLAFYYSFFWLPFICHHSGSRIVSSCRWLWLKGFDKVDSSCCQVKLGLEQKATVMSRSERPSMNRERFAWRLWLTIDILIPFLLLRWDSSLISMRCSVE